MFQGQLALKAYPIIALFGLRKLPCSMKSHYQLLRYYNMFIDKNNALDSLKENVSKFLYPIKMGGNVDINAYKQLLLTLDEITRVFKHEDLIPKRLLSEICLTAEGVSSESHNIKNYDLNSMAEEIESKFNLLLSGKTPEDVKPVIGRIV